MNQQDNVKLGNVSLMEDLISTDIGKAVLNSQEDTYKPKMNKRENEIGEFIVKEWRSFTLREKYPFAPVVEKAFNKMLEETLPQDRILSARMQSWINSERNELMVDSRINGNKYFAKTIDEEIGEILKNNKLEIAEKKLELIQREIGKFQKALRTTMETKPEIFYANKETLEKWQNYYEVKSQQVKESLEKGDFSLYNKERDGEILKAGTEQDALQHKDNLENKMAQVRNSMAYTESQIKAQENMGQPQENQSQESTQDYTAGKKYKP